MPRSNYKKQFCIINSPTQRKSRKLETDMINEALNELSTSSVSNVPSNVPTFEVIENDSHTSIFDQDEIDADLLNDEIRCDDSDKTNSSLSSEEENNEFLPLFEQQQFLNNDKNKDTAQGTH